MNHTTLIFNLSKFAREANFITHHNANCGGCAVIAAIVSHCLHQHGIKSEGITEALGGWGRIRGAPANPQLTSDWRDNGYSLRHVALRLFMPNGSICTWDTDKLVMDAFKFGEFEYYVAAMPVGKGLKPHELLSLAKCEGWNPSFDRDEYIPQLLNLAERLFKVDVSPLRYQFA